MKSDFIDISYKRILTLHPQLQESALKCYTACIEKEIPLYIVWARQTVQEHNALYRIGRDMPGDIKTYIRSEYSPFCYGLALEFCLYTDTEFVEWTRCTNSKYWRWKWIKVMKIYEQAGWSSGWRWTNFQPGYLENLLGKTILEHKNETESTDKNRDNWKSLL